MLSSYMILYAGNNFFLNHWAKLGSYSLPKSICNLNNPWALQPFCAIYLLCVQVTSRIHVLGKKEKKKKLNNIINK